MYKQSYSSTIGSRVTDKVSYVVAFLLVVDSLHFVFARLLLPYLPPGTSALYVLGIATLETAVFLAIQGRININIFRRYAPFFLVVGFLVAAATMLRNAN